MSETKEKQAEEKLTTKQKVFCDYYVGEARFNAKKAAILAGYSERSAASLGSENLKRPVIQKYIEDRLKELTLGANEVLARLTEIANGSVEQFVDDDGNFDFKAAKTAGALPLLKKLKRKKTSKSLVEKIDAVGEGEAPGEIETLETHEEYDFELYSAHDALRDLGKFHKLLTDRHEVDAVVGHYPMTQEQWEKQAADKLQEANKLGDKFSE